jgi:MoaA/NifB/PqqE/SkfB family radical SAM enzyme
MCARNYNGGEERSFVGNFEISIDDFTEWFELKTLSNLKHFYACGNYGDPILAKDCLEIFEYVRNNSDAKLGIHTNGSARDTIWWKKLAEVFRSTDEVVFGIDGFEESHILYRRGTIWKKIIENAKTFIDNGGSALIDCLVFKHNESELKEFEKQMLSIGFKSVNFKSTQRFYDMEKFPVQNKKREIEYYLEPAETPEYKKISIIKLNDIKKDISIWEDMVEKSKLKPKCLKENSIYIDSRGNVLPCCWVGSDILEEPLNESLTIHALRNQLVNKTKENFKKFIGLNLKTNNISDIVNSGVWQDVHSIEENKPWICVKNCAQL